MTRIEARRDRARTIAKDAGLEAVAFVPGPSFRYLTGLDLHLMERPTLLFVTADGALKAIMPELERSQWVASVPEAETYYWQDRDGFDAVFRDCCRSIGGPVGVEGMRMRMFEAEALTRHLPQGAVVNSDAALSALRLHKDENEIADLRRAIEISETALADLYDGARAGDTEVALAARLKQAMLSHGAQGFAFEPIVLSGPQAADPHGAPSDRPIRPGEALLIDFGASWNGMNADITRTAFCEHVTDRDRALYETVRAANAQGRRQAAPGITCDALDRETTAVLAASPFAAFIVHKTGHGLGLDVHEAPQVMEGNETPLAPGMVVTIEPGLYDPGHIGVRIEDDVLITVDGCESLTSIPREVLCFG
jgi:Xaa-Pro dipeptidase